MQEKNIHNRQNTKARKLSKAVIVILSSQSMEMMTVELITRSNKKNTENVRPPHNDQRQDNQQNSSFNMIFQYLSKLELSQSISSQEKMS